MWRASSDYFEEINKNVISQTIVTRPLGTSRTAVIALLRNGEEMKELMPYILGQGYIGNNDQSFTSNVSNYWNSLSYRVPFPSVTWEIGMTFDINSDNPTHAKFIPLLNTSFKLNDEALADYVMGSNTNGKYNVPIEDRYKYGTPINPFEFLLWQYCLNYNVVANDKSLVDKSLKIQFYLIDETRVKLERVSIHNVKNEAKRVYLEVIAKSDDVTDILSILKKSIPFDTPKDEIKIVNEQLLETVVEQTPAEFLEIAKSSNLKMLAKIERYIVSGVIKRLDGTNTLVDSDNPEIVIGNTREEQLAYFNNTINKDIIANYSAKYKSLKLNK